MYVLPWHEVYGPVPFLSYLYNESLKRVYSYAEGGEKRKERGVMQEGGTRRGEGVKVVLRFAPEVFKLTVFL